MEGKINMELGERVFSDLNLKKIVDISLIVMH